MTLNNGCSKETFGSSSFLELVRRARILAPGCEVEIEVMLSKNPVAPSAHYNRRDSLDDETPETVLLCKRGHIYYCPDGLVDKTGTRVKPTGCDWPVVLTFGMRRTDDGIETPGVVRGVVQVHMARITQLRRRRSSNPTRLAWLH